VTTDFLVLCSPVSVDQIATHCCVEDRALALCSRQRPLQCLQDNNYVQCSAGGIFILLWW